MRRRAYHGLFNCNLRRIVEYAAQIRLAARRVQGGTGDHR